MRLANGVASPQLITEQVLHLYDQRQTEIIDLTQMFSK